MTEKITEQITAQMTEQNKLHKNFRIQLTSLSYSNEPILQNIHLTLRNGETVAILGPSGCGKSTLLRSLMGLEKEVQGELLIGDVRSTFAEWRPSQKVFGLVPQVPHLFPWKTVFQNLELGVDPSLNTTVRQQNVCEALLNIGLSEEGKKYPSEISVGMASRVSFARSLLVGCEILLLDEPFAALDATTRYHMQLWFLSQISNRSAVFVTHDVREALMVADQIIVLSSKPATIKLQFVSRKKEFESRESWLHSFVYHQSERELLAALT